MTVETIFQITLMIATLLCTLVTGFILLFAIVIMPGIGTLNDREFLHAFQAVDRVIQENQPLFAVIWIGSALALLVATVLGIGQLEGMARVLLVVAAAAFILGTQLPTIAVNVPLNNRVQTLNIDTLNETEPRVERQRFEPRWNRWNVIRTAFASLASVQLIILLWIL